MGKSLAGDLENNLESKRTWQYFSWYLLVYQKEHLFW